MFQKIWAVWIAATWWVSLLTVGLLVVPLLFRFLPTPAIAGYIAAQLFAVQTWLSLACGICLLFWFIKKPLPLVPFDYFAIILIVSGLLAAIVVQWFIAPRIVLRQDLVLWHRLGTIGMAIHAICAVGVFWRVVRGLFHSAVTLAVTSDRSEVDPV